MHIGRQDYKIDPKNNRIMCPAELRQSADGQPTVLFLTMNAATNVHDRCMEVRTESQFAIYYEQLKKIPRNNRAFTVASHIMGNAVRVVVDTNGKIIIPVFLQKYAGITVTENPTLAVVARHYDDHTEMWSSARLEQKLEADLSDTLAVGEFGRIVYGEPEIDYTDDSVFEKAKMSASRKLELARLNNDIRKQELSSSDDYAE